MKLTPSDFYGYYRPSRCELRVYLRHKNEPEGSRSPYEEVLQRLGMQHEKNHLATFPDVIDVSEGTLEERQLRTIDEVEKGQSQSTGRLKPSSEIKAVAR